MLLLPLVVFNNIRSIAIATAGSIIRSVAGAVSQVGEKVQRGKSGRYIPPDSLDHHSRCKSRPAEDLVMDHHGRQPQWCWWFLVVDLGALNNIYGAKCERVQMC